MCSDSESAGGSSESRSMDSPTASPGAFSDPHFILQSVSHYGTSYIWNTLFKIYNKHVWKWLLISVFIFCIIFIYLFIHLIIHSTLFLPKIAFCAGIKQYIISPIYLFIDFLHSFIHSVLTLNNILLLQLFFILFSQPTLPNNVNILLFSKMFLQMSWNIFFIKWFTADHL